MARRLEGRRFYANYNNGVRAIASAEVVMTGRKRRMIELWISDKSSDDYSRRQTLLEATKTGLAHLRLTPIFTFADSERVKEQPWFTGDNDLHLLLTGYIAEEGGVISLGLYVPFSNGAEMGAHGPEAMSEELKFVTTDGQFEETFGITLKELRERIAAVK